MSENEPGIRGGIEFGFMSTTTNRKAAEFYASGHAFVSIVLEMQMGMVDRGASLSELSQYPHEQKMFRVLTSLEVSSTHVYSNTLVVKARLSVNLMSLTIEEVIAKRIKILTEMRGNLLTEVRNALQDGIWDFNEAVSFV